jgi:hypothetical protein
MAPAVAWLSAELGAVNDPTTISPMHDAPSKRVTDTGWVSQLAAFTDIHHFLKPRTLQRNYYVDLKYQ